MRHLRVVLVALVCVVLVPPGAGADVVEAATVQGPPPGSITWTVDHKAKTITVKVQLEIYPGCSGDPVGEAKGKARACVGPGSQVTRFLADKIRSQIDAVWNKGHFYRCYRLIVVVDIKLGTDRDSTERSRVGVRIDPSPAGIRSYVDTHTNDKSTWRSNDPAHRLAPDNHGEWETTWSETAQGSVGNGQFTYAHELGHVLGLSDAYHDVLDKDGNVIGSEPNEGAPLDLMSDGSGDIAQETIDRLIERNRDDLKDRNGNKVDLSDLRCDYVLEVKMHMVGVHPAFLSTIDAEGTIELTMKSPPSRDGPGTYTGRGNLAYTVSPNSKKPCTFSFKGSGGFPVDVHALIPSPVTSDSVDTIRVIPSPILDKPKKDTLIARRCNRTGKAQPVALFPLFYSDRMGRPWQVRDWGPPTGFAADLVADAVWTGHCVNKICKERDTFTLKEKPESR